ncbi:hypothetical protein J4461_04540 [Candidatus Pacearchaeota archaeon]|nr:hypothetical protein [Candidatus Pacearchaeota archaeon]
MSEKKFCPKCRSENVVIEGSMIEFSSGAMFCKNCGFKDVIFPTKEEIIKTRLKK